MTTGPYRVAEIDLPNGVDPVTTMITCEDCGFECRLDLVADIESCALTPGDPSPVGRCPRCEALVYFVDPRDEAIRSVLQALKELDDLINEPNGHDDYNKALIAASDKARAAIAKAEER
jgi:hypothetical protein